MPRKRQAEVKGTRKRKMSRNEIMEYLTRLADRMGRVREILDEVEEVEIDGGKALEQAAEKVEEFIPKLVGAVEKEKLRKTAGCRSAVMAFGY